MAEVDGVIVNVLLLVMLSESEDPVSSKALKSRVIDGVNVVFSIFTLANSVESAEVTPSRVCAAIIEYVAFANAGENVHEPVAPEAVKLHVKADPEVGVAVKVTVAPAARFPTVNVGVLSAVSLSVLDVPKSDAASKSGVPGADIATVTVCVETADKFPAASTTYRTYVPGANPAAATAVSELAVEIEPLFHKVPSAPVMLVRLETGLILSFTR